MKQNWLLYDNTGRQWLVFSGDGSVWGGTGWYLVLLGQYNLVLLGIKWNQVVTWLLCLYILKKVEIWSDVTIAGRTDKQTNKRPNKERQSYSANGPRTAEMSKKTFIKNHKMQQIPFFLQYWSFFGQILYSIIHIKT